MYNTDRKNSNPHGGRDENVVLIFDRIFMAIKLMCDAFCHLAECSMPFDCGNVRITSLEKKYLKYFKREHCVQAYYIWTVFSLQYAFIVLGMSNPMLFIRSWGNSSWRVVLLFVNLYQSTTYLAYAIRIHLQCGQSLLSRGIVRASRL